MTYLIDKSKQEKLTEVELFKLKNNLTDANFAYLHLLKSLGKPTLGPVKMPNNEIKIIKKNT